MKNFMLILFLCLIPSICNAATSDDVYVRKDIFEVYMKRIDNKFEQIHADIMTIKNDIKEIRTEIKEIRAEIKEIRNEIKELSADIKGINARIDEHDQRINDLHNFLYFWIIIVLAVIALPHIIPTIKILTSRRKELSESDIERIIITLQERKIL